jgi:hypothetical protein
MSRDITSGLNTELTSSVLRPVLFYEGEFSSGFLRLWSGIGTMTWDSKDWTGAGYLLGLSPIEETGDVRASGMSISLSGMPSSLIATALSEARQGKPGKVWVGALDATGAVVADPNLHFWGRLDVPAIDEQGDTCTITVTYESRLISLGRSRERRYTLEDQKIDFPEDKAFEFVESLQDATITWGRG